MIIIQMQLENRTHEDGSVLRALFTVDVGALRIKDCALISYPDGGMSASVPRSKGGGKVISFLSQQEFYEFQRAAKAAYCGLTGGEQTTAREPVAADVEDSLQMAGIDA